MTINTETRIIARLHTQNSGTGLNIYNPYFQDQKLNVVYLLFTNSKPDPLVDGIRKLNISGAITAGFEHDPVLPKIVDERSEAVELAQRVGILINNNGVIKAHYQGGEGLLSAVEEKVDIAGKRIVIVGAGTVAKTFILALEDGKQKPKEIVVCNRTKDNADWIKNRFDSVIQASSLEDLGTVEGDVLINASRIGSSTVDEVYTSEVVSRFTAIADVTFGVESTNLTDLALKANKTVVSGWDMFTHQAAVVLKQILDHDANIDRLREYVRKGLASNNHGAVATKK